MTRPLLVAYRALGLGDLLTGLPALRALRDAFPDHRIVLAAPAALAPLAALSGAVDAVADTAPLGVPPTGANVAVNLHGRGPESHRAIEAARPRRTLAFACPAAGVPHGPAWRAREHEVERWCRLLRESGIPADASRLDLPPPPPSLLAVAGATVIHPGAASAARRWPVDRWAAVARSERRRGRPVLVTGSETERPLAEAVARGAGLSAGAVLAGRTGLLALAAVVDAAGCVVCGDTGVAHVATAWGTPSVVLFGPTPPEEWGAPPDRSQHISLHHGARGNPHGDTPDPGLLAITVTEVLAAINSRAARQSGARQGGPRRVASLSRPSATSATGSHA